MADEIKLQIKKWTDSTLKEIENLEKAKKQFTGNIFSWLLH